MIALHQAFDMHPFLSTRRRSPFQCDGLSGMPLDTAELRLTESEAGTAYELHVSVPGMKPKDFNVSLEGETLTVEGETLTDRRHLKFQRRLTLPRDADALSEAVGATHADGILTISIPKSTLPEPRKLTVVAAPPAALPGTASPAEDAA